MCVCVCVCGVWVGGGVQDVSDSEKHLIGQNI